MALIRSGELEGALLTLCFWHTDRAELLYLRPLIGMEGSAVAVKLLNVIRHAEATPAGKAAVVGALTALRYMFQLSDRRFRGVEKDVLGKCCPL